MTSIILKNNKFNIFLDKNLDNEKIGFYFSIIIHFIILLFAIGIPNFFEPKDIALPNIIPIEIINISENTSIPEKIEKVKEKEKKIDKSLSENKKFNSSDNQEIIKKEIKTKPKVEQKQKELNNLITTKEDMVIKEKAKTPIKLEKEKKDVLEEKVEKLPTKKIVPKSKPELKDEIKIEKKSDVISSFQPKPKPEKNFSIASMLKDLRNEKSSIVKEKKEEVKKTNETKNNAEKSEKNNSEFTISEIDLLRQQLSACWIAPAGAVIEKGMNVKISAKVRQNKRIYEDTVRIVDTNISKSNTFYGPITESAMRTLLNPDCIPLKLPDNKYSLWKNITITFDYSIMKGYE